MYKPFQGLYIFILTACFALIFISGCTQNRSYNQETNRSWNSTYTETVYVQTEPTGSRLYIQEKYVGLSPLSHPILTANFKMVQTGTYRVDYVQEAPCMGGARITTGQTEPSWSSRPTSNDIPRNNSYTIKAFKEGYQTAEKQITIRTDDTSFIRAIQFAKVDDNGRMVTSFHGKRSVLLTLRPLPSAPRQPFPKQQQQQQQQQTVVIPGVVNEKALKKGTIIISSIPQFADVIVDGIFVGNTPSKLSLTDGIHIIEVKHPGYNTFRRELRVFSDSEVTIKALLEKE